MNLKKITSLAVMHLDEFKLKNLISDKSKKYLTII